MSQCPSSSDSWGRRSERRGAALARLVTMTVTRGDLEATLKQEEREAIFWFRGIAGFCHVQRSWSPSELVFRQNVSVAIPLTAPAAVCKIASAQRQLLRKYKFVQDRFHPLRWPSFTLLFARYACNCDEHVTRAIAHSQKQHGLAI